jgi:hypothetical protein
MSLADDLLELAKKSVNYNRSDVLDARLRRSVSTGYYALFHLLLEHGAARIVGHPGLRQLVSRAYVHGDMYRAAKAFRSGAGGLPSLLIAPFGAVAPAVPREIIDVATAFVDLQEARHEADYNLAKTFSRAEARRLVFQVGKAFTDWRAVVAMPLHGEICDLFLATLLLGERWKK